MGNHILKEPPGEPFVRVEEGKIRVHIPMRFKRRSGRKEILIPEPGQDDKPLSPMAQRPLAIAVARAHRWLARLEDGTFGSVSELAEVVRLDPSRVRRFLNLTVLPPSLTIRILAGEESADTTLDALARNVEVRWR
jgi:hypothetical protein